VYAKWGVRNEAKTKKQQPTEKALIKIETTGVNLRKTYAVFNLNFG
jgi:hypothetical protein